METMKARNLKEARKYIRKIDELLVQAYGGDNYDPLCEHAMNVLEELRLEMEFLEKKANNSNHEDEEC